MIKTSTEKTFAADIYKSVALVLFGARACSPCNAISKILDELEIPVYKVDVEVELGLASQFNIRTVPSMIIYRWGQVSSYRAGSLTRGQIMNWLMQED